VVNQLNNLFRSFIQLVLKEVAMDKGISSTIKWALIFALLGLFALFSRLYTDYLWFDSVNFGNVFSIILLNKVLLYIIALVLTFLLFFINLQLTRKSDGPDSERPRETDDGREIIYLNTERSPWKGLLKGPFSNWIFLGISLLGAFMVSSIAADQWLVVQQYLNSVSTGITDPLFNKDISFYFFNLTFYQFLYNTFMTALVLLLVAVGTIYIAKASTDIIFGNWKQFSFAKCHIAVIVAAIFALKSWGYRLASYDLLISPGGVIYGASYSDVVARLLSYKVLMVISLITAAVIIANIFIRRLNWIVLSVGAWIALAIILGSVYPAVIQKLVVQPNEYNKEKPYIEKAIQYTRMAYGLDRAEELEFRIDYDLDIYSEENQITVNNIRLWDWQPLQTTYQNLQALRSYYVFNDVDVDRYIVDGAYRQVMISARELDQRGLQETAQTWINQKLMYTHGYGVLVSPVTEVAEEGFPQFFIKDIPPETNTDLKLERPEIYFGEVPSSYVLVNTEQQEFDYPLGTQNAYSTYQGQHGIKLDSLMKRLLFAWELKDYKMLLSSDITNQSQLLMNRNIEGRISKIAPYLIFDRDPYIVIDDSGKLFWMIDAYTYSNKYPYSEPFDRQGNNYLRNSVKITCDAYTGEMKFYVADESDPIINTFSKIFPGVFLPLDQMPAGLKAHIRYPVDLFSIQAGMFSIFHMTDPNVFYNKEDPWLIPTEIVDDKQQNMEPYYIIMRLPGEEKEEYILMLPFTPKNRPNMVAWMCARMDGENYGKMLIYNFPKQETIYGPQQIESRIDQDTYISQQLSLWSQQGSSVYRGNLLVIPMSNSILYIEPLYLQASNSKLPELKRVIAGFGNRVVMEPTLEEALTQLFGKGTTKPPATPGDDQEPGAPQETADTIQDLARQARQYYDQANERLREGDWAGYGQSINRLNEIIKRMEAAVSQL
jgi:uncharacterized membrane protein (UPF0182 family)